MTGRVLASCQILSKCNFLFYFCFKIRNICDLRFPINTIMCPVCVLFIFVFISSNILAKFCVLVRQLQFGRVACCVFLVPKLNFCDWAWLLFAKNAVSQSTTEQP